jgi:vesicle coat complex subunit
MAAIGNLAPEACESLIQALTNADTQLRRYAVTGLLQFRSSQMEKVAPALLDRLRNDPDGGVQSNATLPALLREIESKSVSARRWSLVALGSFTNEAPAIEPAIVKALEDKDVGVRQAATNALKAIDPEAAARAGVK